ncbi:hypothetical protein KDK_45960 [Dictyobacter kobayashii]|uniref:Clp R domain-containing protein n=1 Tax=Dictyobacter kobayashii TaxID=2014872 RepID=A0A402ANV4_9CHLR|nr:hypothetical protein KDK_45960 [Dictyobacter kobayashii]
MRNFALSVVKERGNNPLSLEQLLQEHPPTGLEVYAPQRIDPEAHAEEHELQQLLLTVISTLSEKERSAVLLYYYQQHSIQEIATLLNISETAVKSRLFKARRTLRGQLAAEYELRFPQVTSSKGKKIMAEEKQAWQSGRPVPPKFSQAMIRVITLTYTEARLLDQPFLGTEHLLLALLHTEIGEAAELLSQAGMNLELTREAVRTVSPHLEGETARGMSQDTINVQAGAIKLAQHFQHQELQPIHVLLSLLLQEQSVAQQALQQLHIQPEQLRDQVLRHLSGTGTESALDVTTLQQVIVLEQPPVMPPQADQSKTRTIDTRTESGIELDIDRAAQTLQETQQKLLKKYPAGDPQHERLKQVFENSQRRLALTRRPDSPNGRARVSVSYTDVLMHANTIRLHFDHSHAAPEHLLYGILQLSSSQARAAQILDRLQIERSTMLQALEQFLSEQSYELTGTIKGLTTTAASEAINYAYEEAHQLGHNLIGAEHLMLGLLRQEEGFSAKLMRKAGLDTAKIRDELARLPDPVL